MHQSPQKAKILNFYPPLPQQHFISPYQMERIIIKPKVSVLYQKIYFLNPWFFSMLYSGFSYCSFENWYFSDFFLSIFSNFDRCGCCTQFPFTKHPEMSLSPSQTPSCASLAFDFDIWFFTQPFQRKLPETLRQNPQL